MLANQRLLNEASPVGLPGVFDWPLCGEEAGCGGRFKKSASGYGKYGTKQDCIEGALEELVLSCLLTLYTAVMSFEIPHGATSRVGS